MAETAAQKKIRLAKEAKAKSATADAAILKTLQTEHPQWAQWVLQNPELKKTILAWAKIPGGPTQEQIDAAVYPTKLVQDYNSIQQRLDKIQALSPGEYKYEVDQAGKWVDQEIASQGINVSFDNRQKLIDATLNNGWAQGSKNLRDAVAGYYDASTTTVGSAVGAKNVSSATSGTAATAMADFAKIAADYGVPVPTDPTKLNDFVKQAIGSNGSEQAFTDYAKAQAIQLYPWMKATLEAGGTVKGWLQPIATQLANTLDTTPDAINWQDPKWSGLISSFDPKTGISAPRNINDILTTVKTDPKYGYDQTMTAKNNAYDLAASIKQTFGFGA